MSLSAISTLRRELDALSLELDADEPVPLGDLLRRARTLRDEAGAVGIEVFAGTAALREGEILLRSDDPAGAAVALQDAAAALARSAHTDLRTVALAHLSDALIRSGQAARVLDVAAEGIALVEKDRYKTSAPYLQAGYLRRTIRLYANGVAAALATGDPRALVWTELSKSRVLPDRGGQPSREGQPHERADDAAAGDRGGTPQDAAALGARLDDLSERIDGYAARGLDTAPLRRQRRILFDRLAAVERRASRMPDFDLDGVRAALASDQRALSYYWLDQTRLLVAVVSRDDLILHVQPVPPDDRTLLVEFARVVQGARGPFDPGVEEGFVDRALARLGAHLLPPAVLDALAGTRRLIVSPHQALHTVPFGALPVRGVPLVRRMAVASVPNLTCLQLPEPAERPARLLAVGAVDYDVAGHPVGPLPQAEAEVADVAAAYGNRGLAADTLVGPHAVEATLRERCSDPATTPTCLHFAVHGASVESDTPLESWLLLPASRLDGLDVARWCLPGATVVLSACSSGQRAIRGRGHDELAGDDMLGLQAAFFAAGARQVLGAMWPVDDDIARRITTRFHAGLLDGDDADVALQRAVLAHIDGAGPADQASELWASFFLTCVGTPVGIRSLR